MPSGNNGGLPPGAYSDHLTFITNEKSGRFGMRGSVVEQVIIGLTVFFAVVVLIALLIVCLMRGGSAAFCKIGLSRRGRLCALVEEGCFAVA